MLEQLRGFLLAGKSSARRLTPPQQLQDDRELVRSRDWKLLMLIQYTRQATDSLDAQASGIDNRIGTAATGRGVGSVGCERPPVSSIRPSVWYLRGT